MVLGECLCKEVETANQWYNRNEMIVNQSKHPAFPVKDSIDIFGLTLTANFNYLINPHLLPAERLINNQFNIML